MISNNFPNKLPKLIGLAGLKRCGKDTGAHYLVQEHNYVQYAFADALKSACKEIFLLDDDQMEKFKEIPDTRWNGLTPRVIFQYFGTEIVRNQFHTVFPQLEEIANDFWTYRFELWYREMCRKNPNVRVVVSDIRFENESNIIKKYGGIVIKITRNHQNMSGKSDKNDNTDHHSSEMNIDKIDADICVSNNHTIEEYQNILAAIVGS